MYKITKPKLNVNEQIDHLVKKGVKFDIISKENAVKYLSENNNYFKLTAYRKTFLKHPGGISAGMYIDLDFEMLKDLSIIDMRLRYALLHMALDVEHFAKVRLLKLIENSIEDGYQIVIDFIKSLSKEQKDFLKSELDRNRDNPYCGDIFGKYENDYPVWTFVEIIPFGRFISFYSFCADRFHDNKLKDEYYLLKSIKDLRNATAHNNCIINDLTPNNSKYRTKFCVNRELSKIGISKSKRDLKMSNTRIQQIVTLLYNHKRLVSSDGVHQYQSKTLNTIVERMFHHIDYYEKNETITTTFKFLKLVIDKWFPFAYNEST